MAATPSSVQMLKAEGYRVAPGPRKHEIYDVLFVNDTYGVIDKNKI